MDEVGARTHGVERVREDGAEVRGERAGEGYFSAVRAGAPGREGVDAMGKV